MPNERANRSREKQIGRAAGERASERASDANGGRTGRSFCSARPRSARDSRACQSAAELRAPSPQLSKRSAGASVACETMPVASLSIVWPRLDLPRCSRRRRRSNCNSCCRHARRPLEPIGRPFCCNFSMNLLAGRPAGRPSELDQVRPQTMGLECRLCGSPARSLACAWLRVRARTLRPINGANLCLGHCAAWPPSQSVRSPTRIDWLPRSENNCQAGRLFGENCASLARRQTTTKGANPLAGQLIK